MDEGDEGVQRIVVNRQHGAFSLSESAIEWLQERGADWTNDDPARDDPLLVECVEALGEEASGSFADLQIVEIPEGVDWQIEDDDGVEWVAEEHRTWRP